MSPHVKSEVIALRHWLGVMPWFPLVSGNKKRVERQHLLFIWLLYEDALAETRNVLNVLILLFA